MRAIWIIASLIGAAASAEELPPDPTLGFALHLLDRGDYYRAIGELERFRYQAPKSPEAFAAGMMIGRAYELGGKPLDAATWLEELRRQAPTPSLHAEAWVEQAYAHALGGPLGAPQTLDDLNAFFADREVFGRASRDTRDRAQYLLGWSYLENGDAFAASRELRKVDLPWAGRLADAVDVRDRLPHKSPLLAGALSVVVPGLGHVYLGQPLIGVAALGWNGLFTAAAVDTAIHKLYGVTAVLGGLELLWYGGAILGAVSGAYKYNRDAELNHEEELKRVYDSAPSSWPPREPAVEPTPQSEKSPPSSSLEAARRASATAFLRASPSRASSMVTST
jgi:hypothetical protein